MWKTWLHSPQTIVEVYQLSFSSLMIEGKKHKRFVLTQRTVISRYFALWATALVRQPADPTLVIVIIIVVPFGIVVQLVRFSRGVPFPCRNRVVRHDLQFHLDDQLVFKSSSRGV